MSIQDSFVGDDQDRAFYSQTYFKQMSARNIPVAEVTFPKSEDLRVHLVRSDLLDKLEEHRHNQSIWSACVGLFAGAALGIIVNWATGDAITPPSWILVIAFSFVAGMFGYFFHRDGQRSETTKDKLLNSRDD